MKNKTVKMKTTKYKRKPKVKVDSLSILNDNMIDTLDQSMAEYCYPKKINSEPSQEETAEFQPLTYGEQFFIFGMSLLIILLVTIGYIYTGA